MLREDMMEIIAGLLLLLFGGDFLVRGASSLARKLGVSELMIGLTLVGFGTSTPELVTSIKAALIGSPGISIGNVVGSNIANILLILGASALIYPIICQAQAMKRDAAALLISALCCVAITLYGLLTLPIGLAFVALLIAYVTYVYTQEKLDPDSKQTETDNNAVAVAPDKLIIALPMVAVGIAMTIYGANLLVEGAVELARTYNVSETTIGLTIVAVGTSLPELVTSVIAAIRKNADIALGNVIGSNIYNIWFILGATAIVQPISIPESVAQLDIWVMLAATLLLIGVTMFRQRISRIMAIVFLGLYTAYMVYLI